ncbi:hypothetical protein GCM10022419_010160 [Nonomuraea rosea]|uniref:Uncharacterized protein n=1 Tax=Nonomuraea rosea TaxID=638574 RepID=A0ABP6VFL0_9ACTN
MGTIVTFAAPVTSWSGVMSIPPAEEIPEASVVRRALALAMTTSSRSVGYGDGVLLLRSVRRLFGGMAFLLA